MLVTLLGIAAFAVDLGWFYLNASRIQRAADAGALAGVIYMPADFTTASAVANQITTANGYTDGAGFVDIQVDPVVAQPHQLQVTIQDTVPTFFLNALGFQTQTITRRARAQFIPPLPMGSPNNQFGNSCDPLQFSNCGDNFWANIHGRNTDTIMGDAYSSFCRGSSGNPGCTQNGLYRSQGFLYGIEANGNGSFTVEFNDIVFRNISGGQTTSDFIRTGDRGCEPGAWGTNLPGCGPTVRVSLYEPDPTPLDVSNNVLICSTDISPQPQVAPTAPYSFSPPAACFTSVTAGPGIYVLQVQVLGTGADPDGLNRYSVRTMPSSTRLYALGDMSIYNNATGTTTQFYLAEVDSIYKGKTLVIELYDAGESAQTGTLQVIDPSGNPFDDGDCRIYSRTQTTATPPPWSLQSTPSICQESVSPQEYNGRWLKFEMDLPSDYACTNCWWKMNYGYASGVNDTTTWRAYIRGNPIHLVPTS
jgi:hypothetical protein